MTTYNKQTLATFFQQGDIPQGSDFSNLIDSQVNIVETSVQVMGGALNTPELITSRLSATNGNFLQTVSANILHSEQLFVSAAFFGPVSAASLNVTGDISAATGTVYASAMRSTNGFIGSSGVINAAGTAQATAATLTNIVNFGNGVVDGSTTGFVPISNRPGLVQYLYNNGVSANLWPPSGRFINGLAVNTPFPLVASAMVTIVHLTTSAYGVK